VTLHLLRGNTYGFVGYTPAGKLSGYDNVFRQTINSFGPLRNQAALNVKPARVELVKLPRAMTIEQFNSQYPSSIKLGELAIINEVDSTNDAVAGGEDGESGWWGDGERRGTPRGGCRGRR